MVMQRIMEPFTWGSGGRKLTPEQVAREREMAAALAGSIGDTSPVGHWTAGMARMVDALGSRMREGRADRAEQEGMEQGRNTMAPIIQALAGGGGAPGAASFDAPAGANADAIRSGLIARGLPDHVADGFLMNFQDESGLNPDINEVSPLVPGSRGGYGLAQWTGPRRVALEEFAASRGVPASDLDTQLDFLMTELSGPEARAAQSIMSSQDPGTAAAAIARDFLRPSQEHLDRRVASYTGGNVTASAMNQPEGQANLIQALMSASGDPWAQQQYGPIIQALMGQQMQGMDPMYQAQLENMQLKNEGLRNPAPPDPFTLSPGQQRFDGMGNVMASVDAAPDNPTSVQEYQFYVDQARAAGQQPVPYDQWDISRRRSGATQISVGADGQRMGTIPAGMAVIEDPTDPSGFRMVPIPGGPVAAEVEATAAQAETREEQARTWNTIVNQDIDRALDLIANSTLPTTGMFGDLLSGIGGTGARDLRGLIDTVKANAGFDRLQAMRDSSPTGGALGQVSERELAFLQSTIGNLEQSQGREQIEFNLNRLKKIYTNMLEGRRAYDGLLDEPQPGQRRRFNPQTGGLE